MGAAEKLGISFRDIKLVELSKADNRPSIWVRDGAVLLRLGHGLSSIIRHDRVAILLSTRDKNSSIDLIQQLSNIYNEKCNLPSSRRNLGRRIVANVPVEDKIETSSPPLQVVSSVWSAMLLTSHNASISSTNYDSSQMKNIDDSENMSHSQHHDHESDFYVPSVYSRPPMVAQTSPSTEQSPNNQKDDSNTSSTQSAKQPATNPMALFTLACAQPLSKSVGSADSFIHIKHSLPVHPPPPSSPSAVILGGKNERESFSDKKMKRAHNRRMQTKRARFAAEEEHSASEVSLGAIREEVNEEVIPPGTRHYDENYSAANLLGDLGKALTHNVPTFERVVLDRLLHYSILGFREKLDELDESVQYLTRSLFDNSGIRSYDVWAEGLKTKTDIEELMSTVDGFIEALQFLLDEPVDFLNLHLTEKANGLDLSQINTSQMEVLLEIHKQTAEDLKDDLRSIKKLLENAELAAKMRMDSTRNMMMEVELRIACATAIIALITLITGFMGMNLTNGFEQSNFAFLAVVTACLILGVSLNMVVTQRFRAMALISPGAFSSNFTSRRWIQKNKGNVNMNIAEGIAIKKAQSELKSESVMKRLFKWRT